jgi:hypothetical protein
MMIVGCGSASAPPPEAPPETPTGEITPLTAEPVDEPAATDPAAAQPTPGPPTETPSAEPSAATAAEPDATSQGCAKDPTSETPVRTDSLGEGDRLIRVKNAAKEELQVRLLGGDDHPAMPGTLRIAPGATAEYRVPAGKYRLRYRVETTCAVLEGSPIVLTGRRSGVEISLKTGAGAGRAGIKRVTDDL